MRPSKKLQREWDQKLKDSGFKDAECGADEDRTLKQFHSVRYPGMISQKGDGLMGYQRRDYFLMLSEYVAHAKFKSEYERQIMEQFCDGRSKEEISKDLGGHRTTVYSVIDKHLIFAGLYGK